MKKETTKKKTKTTEQQLEKISESANKLNNNGGLYDPNDSENAFEVLKELKFFDKLGNLLGEIGLDENSQAPDFMKIFGGNESANIEFPSVEKDKKVKEWKLKTPEQIVSELDQYVIGQNEAKEYLAAAAYNHYKRNAIMKEHPELEIQKSNILMVGPSGCGKTYIIQNLAKILDVDVVLLTATDYTPNGYVGTNVEMIPKNILDQCGGSFERAERCIVYIDEFDKLANKVSSSGNVGNEIQSGILKIIEGGDFAVKSNPRGMFATEIERKLNTNGILFVCGGAFTALRDKRKAEDEKQPLGFTQNAKDKSAMRKLTIDDIIGHGIMREVAGRLPILINLNELTLDEMSDILIKPKNALMKQYKALLAFDGVSLVASKESLNKISELAMKNKTGARGLRTILESVLRKAMYEASKNKNKICEIVIKDNNIKAEIVDSLESDFVAVDI